MKLSKLFAVCSIGAMLAVPAYCEGMEFIYNDTVINADAKIINDRTMINIDSLDELGITVGNADGVWSFERNGIKLEYDEKTELVSLDGEETAYDDAYPILTSNEKLVPLRATAENLGILVGWDYYEEKVVLVDFNAYLEALKEEHPDLYKLLNVQVKPVGQGTTKTKVSMNVEIPDEEEISKVKLDISGTSAIKGDSTQGGLVLEGLSLEGERFNYSLSDVTFDAVYDAETMTAYFKTNIIGKVKDSLPDEYKEQIDSVSAVFTEDVWYKISIKEYFDKMLEEMPDDEYLREEISEMYETIEDYRKNGVNLSEVVNQMVEDGIYIDDIYAFEGIKAVMDVCALLVDNKLLELEFDGDNLKSIKIDVDKNKLMDFVVNVYAPAIGYELTAEELGLAEEEFAGYDFKLKLLCEFIDGISSNTEVELLIKADGVTFEVSADESVDGNNVPENIAIPEAAIDFIALVEMMVQAEEV